MAIWDEKETGDKASTAFTQNCPSCGSKLVFDPESGFLKCGSCGSDYDPSMFDVLAALDNIDDDDDDPEDPFDMLEGSSEFICSSCGASVITDATTSATFCRFCGNPVVMGTRLTKKFRPEKMIPFRIDRESAEKIFKQWAAEHKYAPPDFTSASTLKKLTGIYVPFWLVTSKALTQDYFRSTTHTPAGKEFATSKAAAVFTFEHVPFDGSKRINDNLMESIEPFDFESLTDFEPTCLQGFYAERYDLSAKNTDMARRITDRFNSYAKKAISDITAASFDTVENEICRVKLGDISACYALLPVWFLKYDYEGKSYSFAINGQNGKAGGSAPASRFKIIMDLLFGKSALTISALIAFVFFTALAFVMSFFEAVSEIAYLPGICAGACLLYLIYRIYLSVQGVDSVVLKETVTMAGYDSYLKPDYKKNLKILKNVLATETVTDAVMKKVNSISDTLMNSLSETKY